MSMLHVHGGDFLPGDARYTGGCLFLRTPAHRFVGEKIPLSKVVSVEAITQENKKTLAGTVGWGAVGAVVAGPLGLLAGALVGGQNSQVTFVLILLDGRKAVATTDHATYAALLGAVVTNQQKPTKPVKRRQNTDTLDYLNAITPHAKTEVSCPYCSQPIQNDPALTGQMVACPYCEQLFEMPAEDPFDFLQ